MKAPFSLFLALRYLKPKRTFISTITLVSVLGVTLGITVLILVISVMTGFDQELRRKVLGFEPHLVITSDAALGNWRALEKQLAKTPGVLAVSPFIQGPVIAEHDGMVLTPFMRGIDPEQEQNVIDLKSLVKEPKGKVDLSGDSAIIGKDLAASLGVGVGDKLTIYAPGNIRSVIDELKKEQGEDAKKKTLADLKNDIVMPAEITITGIFDSGRYDYDANVLFVPLFLAQELYALEDAVHGIAVKTADPYGAEKMKETLNKTLPPTIYAQTWIDRNKDRFDAIRLERSVMFFILFFIIIVAAFGIMNTLITVTVQKTREIGIMKALGANTGQIVWVFLAQGMVVGFFGTLTGLGLGMALVRFRNEFRDWLANTLNIQVFPADIYEFSKIPAEVIPRDVAIICGCAFLICSIAALIPAWFAARLDPVKALRYE
jgi:lipoprotein-releasing system permease protein